MEMKGNTVLITGGATGIGFALAERLAKSGNEVIICGRRQERLDEAVRKVPGLHARRCDISKDSDRRELVGWIKENFKGMNVLINNAGIQRRIDLKAGAEALPAEESEIAINFEAQVYLTEHLMPVLLGAKDAAVVNVSSGLGIIPLARFPIYCATKAALHSFTMSLRKQMEGTGVKVFEILPPTVHDTELKGKPIPKNDHSMPAAEVADAAIAALSRGEQEIAIGRAAGWVAASKEQREQIFSTINQG